MKVSVRWRKLVRDAQAERGRVALMVGALVISLGALGAVAGASGILSREIRASYAGAHPASATLELAAPVNAALVEEVKHFPGIAEAQAGEIVTARAQVADTWRPLLLFVVPRFDEQRLNVFHAQSGAWPPPRGTLLVERTALAVLETETGARLLVKTPRGQAQPLTVSGVVHDRGLAPAWQEEEGYGYITPETLGDLEGEPGLHELRVLLQGPAASSRTAIETKTDELATWLRGRGVVVLQARIPPPQRHPHQTQMEGVLFLLLTFAALSLLLAAILVANGLASMLARQVREIGVLKTVGATTRQLFGLYSVFVACLGLVALPLAAPLAWVGAGALARMSGGMLNLALADLSIPRWVPLAMVGAGLLVPWALATLTLGRAARMSPRQAMDSHGASAAPARATGIFRRRTGSRGSLSRWRLAARNATRRPGRFALALGLLGVGGALFLAAHNLVRGWAGVVDQIYRTRSYDVELRVREAMALSPALAALPGVRALEVWGHAPAALGRPGHIEVVRTYPDGSHGSLTLLGPPVDTGLVHFPLLAGRWLRAGDDDAVVISHMVLAQAPGAKVGDTLSLSVAGRISSWKIVGIVEEVGSAGMAYVTPQAFARAVPEPAAHQMIRLATDAPAGAARDALIGRLEDELARRQAHVVSLVPLAVLRTAMGDHVLVLARLLLAMGALMGVVGGLGLASTMTTAVLERTRELGIMKTLGAEARLITGLYLREALVIAAASAALALALSVPLTAALGRAVGMLSFRVALPLRFDERALAGWLLLVAAISVVATWWPARRAARMPVREALAEV